MDTDARRCLSLVYMMVIGITGLLFYGCVAMPQFDSSPPFVMFVENKSTPIGTVLFRLKATDSSDPLSEMTIFTNDAETSFYVNILQLSKTNPALANITLKNELDRESNEAGIDLKFYLINQSGYNDTKFVRIYIFDACDEAPVFERPSYTLEIDEIDISSARLVFSEIHATDRDNGNYAIVTYRMEHAFVIRVTAIDGDLDIPNPISYIFIQSDRFCQEHFVLNATTGEIVINGSLGWETDEMKRINGVCNFIVQAKEIDKHPENQRGQTVANVTVTVTILLLNTQAPQINRSTTNKVQTGL